jgi:hypothetical protein
MEDKQMAYKMIHALSHVAQGIALGFPGIATGLDIAVVGTSAGIAVIGSTWGGPVAKMWYCFTGSQPKVMYFPFSGLGIDFSKKVIIGYRVAAQQASTIIAQIGPTASYPGGGLINLSALNLGNIIAIAMNVEIVLDFVNLKSQVFVNGVLKYTRTNTQAEQNLYKTTHNKVIFADSGSSGNGCYVTDIYIRDCEGEVDIGPVGNWGITPITAKAAVANNWTQPASTTPLALINTLPASPYTAPVMTNPGTVPIDPVSIDTTVTGEAGTLRAVSFFTSVGDSVSPAKNMTPTFKDDVGQVVGVTQTVPNFVGLNKNIGILNQPPGGGVWSWAKLKSASVALAFS